MLPVCRIFEKEISGLQCLCSVVCSVYFLRFVISVFFGLQCLCSVVCSVYVLWSAVSMFCDLQCLCSVICSLYFLQIAVSVCTCDLQTTGMFTRDWFQVWWSLHTLSVNYFEDHIFVMTILKYNAKYYCIDKPTIDDSSTNLFCVCLTTWGFICLLSSAVSKLHTAPAGNSI